MRVTELRVTPVAFRDPPLLSCGGLHQPFALRTVIELVTDEGLIGLGETYGSSRMRECLAAIAPVVVGLDPFDLHDLLFRLRPCLAPDLERTNILAPSSLGHKFLARVYGALEVACLDLQGKMLDLPVSALLGGAVRQSVPYSAYLFYKFGAHEDQPYEPDAWGEVLTPDALVAEARTMIADHGFRSIKLKGGVLEPELEIETVRLLRREFPDHPLRIDPNLGWTVATSIRVSQALDGLLEYLEDPAGGLEASAEVARQVSMPIATNMLVTTFADLPPAIRCEAVGVVLADHHYWGGLRASLNLAAVCATWNLGLSMHSNSHLGISLAAMTHLASVVPNLDYACDTHYPWQCEDVIEGGRFAFADGALAVPTGPGLGVELDRDALERLHLQFLDCRIRDRDDRVGMRRRQPTWSPELPRF
jgi:glucarate dehydratase